MYDQTDPQWVVTVQDRLWQCGLGAVVGPVDGDYGPQTTQAVRRFQEAWSYDQLAVDGDVGPATDPCLSRCAGSEGHVSDHFSLWEFRSGDDGTVRLLRGLVVGLELLRVRRGGPMRVVSGYRTPAHNAAVGGARRSQHLVGAAADIEGAETARAVMDLEWFSGIGYREADGLVVHVDVRHLGDYDDGSGPQDPAVWTY